MPHPTRISAQNSQYSSTGVGFQIRNDLNALTTAIYPLFPSQALALRRAHTCMCARIAAIRLLFSIRVRHQSDPKSRPNRNHFRSTLSTTYPHLLAKFTTATIQQPQSDHTTTARQHLHACTTSRKHLHNHTATTMQRPNNAQPTTQQSPTNDQTKPAKPLPRDYKTTPTQPRQPQHAARKTIPYHFQFTCGSLASYLRRHDTISPSWPRTIRVQSNHI